MPELATVILAQCRSNVYWEMEVPGRPYLVRFQKVDPDMRGVEYDYECSCPHYVYRLAARPRGYCKHIQAVERERCGWDQLLHRGKPELKDGEHRCPRCGDGVEFYRASV